MMKENTLPEGWEMKKLGEVCDFVIDKPSQFSGEKKYYTTKSINNKKSYSPVMVTFEKRPGRANLLPKLDDVGFAVMKGTNKVFKIDNETLGGIFSTGFKILRSKSESILIPRFLEIFIKSNLFQEKKDELAGDGIMGGISKVDIKNFQLLVPPIQEQKRIVKILDEVFVNLEEAKKNAEENLKNTKDLFESYLENIFEEKGEDWEEEKLADICEKMFAGGDVPKDNFSKEKTEEFQIPIYANAVKKNGLYGYTNIERVVKPSITIAARGSGTGHITIRNENYYPIVRLIVIIPNEEIVDLKFLKFALKILTIEKSGSAIPQLTIPMMKEYLIPFPKDIKQQKSFVTKLDNLSNVIKELEKIYKEKSEKLEEFKKSILERAFAGEL